MLSWGNGRGATSPYIRSANSKARLHDWLSLRGL